MYIRTYGCMDVHYIRACMYNIWMSVYMDVDGVCMYRWMYIWMNVRTYMHNGVCMYLCMCTIRMY